MSKEIIGLWNRIHVFTLRLCLELMYLQAQLSWIIQHCGECNLSRHNYPRYAGKAILRERQTRQKNKCLIELTFQTYTWLGGRGLINNNIATTLLVKQWACCKASRGRKQNRLKLCSAITHKKISQFNLTRLYFWAKIYFFRHCLSLNYVHPDVTRPSGMDRLCRTPAALCGIFFNIGRCLCTTWCENRQLDGQTDLRVSLRRWLHVRMPRVWSRSR